MPPDRSPDDLVLELAETISDATPVDWDSSSGELDDPRLAQLRALESLAVAFRQSRGRQPAAARRGSPLFRWGHLEVHERLGEGTFGEVFRAYDPLLDREVALKLRKDSPQGHSAVGRRQHLAEARRLARVRHPNVLVVHGADIHQGRVGLWTDLVEGVTLEERLLQSGPFAVDEARAVGRVLCEALAAVHAAGLLHGDVKTSNVLQEATGRVVLADFGAGAELDGGAGALLSRGTPVTLAPEVLRGGKATAAADLYALGALLYRLLTGRYPIEGATLEEIALRVERGEGVPLRQRRPEVPGELATVVDRALAARPEERFVSPEAMGEALAVAAEAGDRSPRASGAASRAGKRWPVAAALFAGAALAALAGVGTARWLQSTDETAAGPFPLADEHRLAFDLPGSVREAAFSPDGTAVAFVRDGAAAAGLWVRTLASGEVRQLAAASLRPQRPRWTAAGVVIFSSREGGLWRVRAEQGEPEAILDRGELPDVAPDGTLVFQGDRYLWLLAPGQSEPRRIDEVPRWYFPSVATSPAFSPDGSLIAFFLPESGPLGDLWVVPTAGGEPRRLTFDFRQAGDPAWTPDGRHLLFWSERQGGRTLWRVPVAGGDPEPVTSGAGEDSAPAVSADGTTLLYTNTRNRWTLTAVDLASCEPRDLLESRLPIALPQLSPGGDRVAFFHPAGSGMHVFTMDLAGAPMEQRTRGEDALNLHPTWWPDGRSLVYYEERPRPALRRLALGSGAEPVELAGGWTWQTHMHARPHPDGRHLAYTGQHASAGSTLVRDLTTGAEWALPDPHLHALRWSPDGRSLAGYTHEPTVRVCDFDGGACRHVVDGASPEWSPDGKWLLFVRAGDQEGTSQLWRSAVDGGREQRLCDLGPQHPLSAGFAPRSADEVVLSRFFQGRDEIWQASLGG